MEPSDADRQVENQTEAETLPVKRRKSIELQKVEIDLNSAVPDSTPPKIERQSYPKPEVIEAPEKQSRMMFCCKQGLIVVTFALAAIGLGIIGVSAWVKIDPDFWNIQTGMDLGQFSHATNITIIVGVVIFVIGFIGFCGAVKESICMLLTYFIIALILVILEITAIGIVWSATNNEQMKEKISKVIKDAIKNWDKDDPSHQVVDLIQTKFECCGVMTKTEYSDNIPRSCRNPETGYIYDQGCLDKLLDYVKQKANLVGGIAIAALLLQIAALGLAIFLFCSIRQGSSKVF